MYVKREDVFSMLSHLGISKDKKLTVHTSLRSVGAIEGGADGLIDSFTEYLSEGLLIIPTHTWKNVNRSSPHFDVRTTLPCIGTLPTVAVRREDGVRSLHPTHSVVAFGEGAEEYIKGEEKCRTPAPIFSCLSRLYEEDGVILLLGVGHERNTYLHAVEERIGVENRINKEGFDIRVTDRNGKSLVIRDYHPHKTEGLPPGVPGVSEFYPNYKYALEYTGAVKYTNLGGALVYCCDARRTADTVIRLWECADRDLCMGDEPISEEYVKKIFD
ncbi:MAG: AAC(3) family N-acetyltransferase [Ruminococcaceae bacterium]|nr:AAC(3) family N-acetyltransferase [Oscillospiraceae bacterium]